VSTAELVRRVLFVCVHNSGRSQMAEAFANRKAQGAVEARSAGTAPADRPNPTVVDAMMELGLDISRSRPKAMTQDMVDRAERVITMGCEIAEGCPVTLVPSEDWGLDDPAGRPIEEVRRIRDEVERRVERLLAELRAAP
jgi:arsenate reductase